MKKAVSRTFYLVGPNKGKTVSLCKDRYPFEKGVLRLAGSAEVMETYTEILGNTYCAYTRHSDGFRDGGGEKAYFPDSKSESAGKGDKGKQKVTLS